MVRRPPKHATRHPSTPPAPPRRCLVRLGLFPCLFTHMFTPPGVTGGCEQPGGQQCEHPNRSHHTNPNDPLGDPQDISRLGWGPKPRGAAAAFTARGEGCSHRVAFRSQLKKSQVLPPQNDCGSFILARRLTCGDIKRLHRTTGCIHTYPLQLKLDGGEYSTMRILEEYVK